VGSLEDKVHKTNTYVVAQQRNNNCCEISTISGELQRAFRICTESIRLGRRYFRHLL